MEMLTTAGKELQNLDSMWVEKKAITFIHVVWPHRKGILFSFVSGPGESMYEQYCKL